MACMQGTKKQHAPLSNPSIRRCCCCCSCCCCLSLSSAWKDIRRACQGRGGPQKNRVDKTHERQKDKFEPFDLPSHP